MAKKTVADVAKAKAAKQKKMAIGLSAFLVLAMGYAVHTMMGLGGSSSGKPEAAPVGVTTPTATPAPSSSPTAIPAAPTLSGAAPTASSPTTTDSSASLIAAVKAPAGAGQLQSFSLFDSKDPFNAGGPGSSSTSSGSSSGSGSGSSSGSTPKTPVTTPKTPPKTPPAPPTAPPTSAVLSVNDTSESVTSGSAFPSANPIFQLISLTANTATISVVGGSYASGSQTLTLKVGKAVTLVNTADGTRYKVELLPQGTQVPAAAAPSASSPAPTSTTPSG